MAKKKKKKKAKKTDLHELYEVNVQIRMPCLLEVPDYHDFDYLADHMQRIFPYHKVVVEEVLGSPRDGTGRFYKGIAYLKGQEREFESLKNKLIEEYAEDE